MRCNTATGPTHGALHLKWKTKGGKEEFEFTSWLKNSVLLPPLVKNVLYQKVALLHHLACLLWFVYSSQYANPDLPLAD